MKIKTKLSDYKSAPLVVEIEGKEVTLNILSAASRVFRDAQAKHNALLEHFKKNDLPETEEAEVEAGGITVKQTVVSPIIARSEAEMMSVLVEGWPDENIVQAIIENRDLFYAIDDVAYNLLMELAEAKKA